MKNDPISLTSFRANIYNLIAELDKSGEPLLLSSKGSLYELKKKKLPARKKAKKINDLSKIIALDIMVEDPDWYISPKLHEWSGEIDSNLP